MLIDILAHEGTADCPYFDVDLSVDRVQLQKATIGILKDTTGQFKFQAKDNFIIISMGIRFPLGFEIEYEETSANATNCFTMFLSYYDNAKRPLSPATIWFPWSNYEMSYGRYFDMSIALTDFYLVSNIVDERPYISMLNIPVELDEKRYYTPIFWKVGHTLPLIALPS